MAVTMINPTSSWFEIAELPVVNWLLQQTVNGKELQIANEIFDKTLEHLTNGCVDFHSVVIWYTTTEVSLDYTWNTCVNHMALSVSQPRLWIHEQIAYWNGYTKS